jgi:hypothetical protein
MMKKLLSRIACIAVVFAMAAPAMADKDEKDNAAKPAAKAKADGAKETTKKETVQKEAVKKEVAKKEAVKKEADKPADGKKRAAVANPMLKAVEALTLTAEQKPKVEEATKEFTETILALRKEGLTQDLTKKKADAIKAAREAGKKGRELEAAVMSTIDATDEEKALLKKAEEANAKLAKAIGSVLTAEQISTLPPQMQQALGAKKPAAPKTAAKKDA